MKEFLAWLVELVRNDEQISLESFDFTTYPKWAELKFTQVDLAEVDQGGKDAFEVYEFNDGASSVYVKFGGEYYDKAGMFWDHHEVYEVYPKEIKATVWERVNAAV